MSYDSTEVNHYTAWIPIKQIDIEKKFYPNVFNEIGRECLQEVFNYLCHVPKWSTASCKTFNMRNLTSNMLNYWKSKENIHQMIRFDEVGTMETYFNKIVK